MGDEAILIDPPGELISQSDVPETAALAEEAKAPDEAGALAFAQDEREPTMSLEPRTPPGTRARLWTNLIDRLARNRSRRPLNGVVMIVDFVTLLHQKPSDRKALAILLRTRLMELNRQLGTRPPLCVVLRKFDQLDCFTPFFARLRRTVREEIFGFHVRTRFNPAVRCADDRAVEPL